MAEPTPAPAPSQPTPVRTSTGRRHQRDMGGLVFGLFLLLMGAYFLATETFGLVLPDLGELWPLFVIGLGLWILVSAMRGHGD